MSRAEKYLPFIIALIAPALGAINNPDATLFNERWDYMLLKYVEVALILLAIWYLNKYLSNRDYLLKEKIGVFPFTALVNLVFISSVVTLDYFFVPNGFSTEMGPIVLIVRLTLVSLILNVIIRVFDSQREREKLRVENLELEAENLKFQVETLKQQINPHFLFNSLNTLLDLIDEDQQAAMKYVRNFSNLYRIVLQSAKHDFIPLADELQFLKDYWNLLKVRFKAAIQLKINIDQEKMDHLIPPLSLQFLIENAVKHNQASLDCPLVVEISDQDQLLMVINRVNPKDYPVPSGNVGLKNLQQRFSMLFQPIEYQKDGDYFKVSLPIKSA